MSEAPHVRFQLLLDEELAQGLADLEGVVTIGRAPPDAAVGLNLDIGTVAAVVTVVVGSAELADLCAKLSAKVKRWHDHRRKEGRGPSVNRVAVQGERRSAVVGVSDEVSEQDVARQIEVLVKD